MDGQGVGLGAKPLDSGKSNKVTNCCTPLKGLCWGSFLHSLQASVVVKVLELGGGPC